MPAVVELSKSSPLDHALFVRRSVHPELIREALTPQTEAVVMTGRRLPALLNEVHFMAKEHG